MRKRISKNRKPYLLALAFLATLILGLAAGAYYEMRQERTCICVTVVRALPVT